MATYFYLRVIAAGDGDQDLVDRMEEAGWALVYQDVDGSVLRGD